MATASSERTHTGHTYLSGRRDHPKKEIKKIYVEIKDYKQFSKDDSFSTTKAPSSHCISFYKLVLVLLCPSITEVVVTWQRKPKPLCLIFKRLSPWADPALTFLAFSHMTPEPYCLVVNPAFQGNDLGMLLRFLCASEWYNISQVLAWPSFEIMAKKLSILFWRQFAKPTRQLFPLWGF